MNDPRDEARVGDAFTQLRLGIEARTPDGAPFIAAAERRARRPRWPAPRVAWAGALGALALIVVAGAWWVVRTSRQESRALRLTAAHGDGLWRAPTDFLLEVPGADLLRTAPSLGTTIPTIATGAARGAHGAPGRRPIRRNAT